LPEVRATEVVLDAQPRSLGTLYQLPRVLRRQAFDLFHGPFNILPSGLTAPTVVTVHDLMQLQNPENIAKSRFVQQTAGLFWRTRIRHAVKNATRIVTVSSATRDAVFEYFPNTAEERVVAAPIGVDPYFFAAPSDDELRLAQQRAGPEPFVFTVGNESPHKNHRRAILAFVEAFPAPSPMRFLIVRRLIRHDPDLVALLDDPRVKGRVVLLDYTELPLLRALYRLARVFFFPSWVEGFGIPILEAMAQGTAVVTSNRNALLEVAGDAAETVSPFSVRAMSEALVRVDQDDAHRKALIERGQARAREFTWGRCAEATLRVYEQALGSNR
jgi:glycosyltransferase involved in cell wall biosynthesis